MRIQIVHFINPYNDRCSRTHILQEIYADHHRWVCKAYKHAFSEMEDDGKMQLNVETDADGDLSHIMVSDEGNVDMHIPARIIGGAPTDEDELIEITCRWCKKWVKRMLAEQKGVL
jgi:hypothetical protein